MLNYLISNYSYINNYMNDLVYIHWFESQYYSVEKEI